MKKKFIEYLCDPIGREDFRRVAVFKDDGEEVIDGLLFGKDSWYPIINGVPRMLVGELKSDMLRNHYSFYKKYRKRLLVRIRREWWGELRNIGDWDKFLAHQKRTGESFAFEWNNIYHENDFERNNYLHYIAPFLKEEDLKGKRIIDIGCGSGRFSKWPAVLGAELVMGVDLGESVEAAYRLTKSFKNVCIVQADIYNLPLKPVFDIAHSIGVIHHLPKPKEGFLKLPATLKKGGKMEIWVYSRRNNNRALYLYEPIRTITRRMPKGLLYVLCYFPAITVHLINWFSKIFNLKKAPFAYYVNFPFDMKLNDAFDVLATPKSNYYFSEEIEEWFREAGLKEVKSFEHEEAGITCVGTK